MATAEGEKGGKKSRGWITLIAIFKLVKAAGLIAVGVAALLFVKEDARDALAHWEANLSFTGGHKLVHRAATELLGLEPKKLAAIGVGTFVYASIFVLEGVGLLLQKRWAEYVTIVVTLSFVPIELYELVEKPTPLRVLALLVNVAVAIYLIVRVRKERKDD